MNEMTPPAAAVAPPGRGRRGIWIGVAVLALACVALIASLILYKPPKPEPVPAAEVPVRIRMVERESVEDRIVLPGRLEASYDAVLPSQKAGAAEALAAARGDEVEAGAVLAQVDARAWAARLESARVEEREAERDAERWAGLFEAGAVPQQELDQARARQDLARAQRVEAEVAADQCVVRAPVKGRIADRLVELGEFVAEGGALYRLVTLDPMRLVVEVPERSVPDLRAGDPLRFEVDAFPGVVFEGRITFVSPVAAPEANTFRVEARVENPDRRLAGGMIARVSLARGLLKDAVVVPLAAVVPRRGDWAVYVEVQGHAVQRVARLQSFVGDRVVLASGLLPGDRLIVEGQRSLADGTPVRVIDGDAAPMAQGDRAP